MITRNKSDLYKRLYGKVPTGLCESWSESEEEDVEFNVDDRVEVLQNGKVIGIVNISKLCPQSVWVQLDGNKKVLKRKKNVRTIDMNNEQTVDI